MNKDSLLYTVIFSLVVTFLLVLPLTVANELTKAQVEQNTRVSDALSILQSMGLPTDKTKPLELIATSDALTKFKKVDGKLVRVTNEEVEKARKAKAAIQPLYFKSEKDGSVVWAGAFTGPGLWGNVTLALGFDQTIERIVGYSPVAQVETPGLGARIADQWFIDQFTGQKVPASGTFKFVAGSGTGDTNKDNDSVDGVTGATITTNAVRDILNSAVAEMKTLTAGGAQ